jgi:hypothetical protein
MWNDEIVMVCEYKIICQRMTWLEERHGLDGFLTAQLTGVKLSAC